MPCTFHLRALAAKVKEGIRDAGGTPMELNTIAISDGITMGTTGHEDLARLARGHRRLDRARRPRPLLRRRHRAQRLRQDDPRHRHGARAPQRPVRDALRRLDPARALQGPRRHDPGGLRGRRRARRGQDDRRGAPRARGRRQPRAPARAAASSPRTRWRWPSRCSASRRWARRWCPRSTRRRPRSPTRPASSSSTCSGAALTPRDIITREALENAIAAVTSSGGSTNGVLHLLAVAREAGVELVDRRLRRASASARRCSATSSPAASTSRSTSTRRAACRCSSTACASSASCTRTRSR